MRSLAAFLRRMLVGVPLVGGGRPATEVDERERTATPAVETEQQNQKMARLRRENEKLRRQSQLGPPTHGNGPPMLFAPRQHSSMVPFGHGAVAYGQSPGGFVAPAPQVNDVDVTRLASLLSVFPLATLRGVF